MLLKIGAIVILLVAGLAGFIATRPDAMHIERSAEIHAPAATAFGLVNDFHNWASWSPFELDSNMKKTFEGPESGKGAIYNWSGNKDVGSGRVTILDSKPNELIQMRLEMFEPYAGENQVRFRFEPVSGGTRVSWIMDGTKNFIFKAMSLVLDCDEMCGQMFDKGLAKLDATAQAEAKNGSGAAAAK